MLRLCFVRLCLGFVVFVYVEALLCLFVLRLCCVYVEALLCLFVLRLCCVCLC